MTTHEAHYLLRKKYKELSAQYETEHVKIPLRATVHLVEGGAFVEAVVWVPEPPKEQT